MTLRAKLLLAQVPLGLALVVVGLVAIWSMSSLARQSKMIFQENYRSVLAAQVMKESIERLDSAALFITAGRADLAAPQIRDNRKRFETELRIQENNITEPGEREATGKLRTAWDRYLEHYDKYQALEDDPGAAIFISPRSSRSLFR